MGRGATFFLLSLGLLVALLAAWGVSAPGYMDADYYYATGLQLAQGRGFWEPFLWNYLDDPAGLPHPSHLYWMPLTSIIAALPMALFGVSFRAAQTPFVVLTGLLPWIVASVALALHARREWAIMAGVLAAWPGFFAPYMVTTDAFAIYTLLGAGLLTILLRVEQGPRPRLWFMAGLLVGLAHLARADGLLLLFPLVFMLSRKMGGAAKAIALIAAGYLLVMGPWFLRNMAVIGSPLSPAGSKGLWLTEYADLFAYPSDRVAPEAWLASGLGSILRTRRDALGLVLERALGENGLVILTPFILAGLWINRRRRSIAALAAGYVAMILFWILFFPLQGAYGGMFHAGAAWMPLFWIMTPIGLERAIQVAALRRGWLLSRAHRLFSGALIALTVSLTIAIYGLRVIGERPGQGLRWQEPFLTYRQVGQVLRSLDADPGLVVVNNPPGFYVAADLPAIVVPHGSVEVLHAVVARYQASWVVLDVNRPPGLNGLYRGHDRPAWLELRGTLADAGGQPILLLEVVSIDQGPSG